MKKTGPADIAELLQQALPEATGPLSLFNMWVGLSLARKVDACDLTHRGPSAKVLHVKNVLSHRGGEETNQRRGNGPGSRGLTFSQPFW